MENEQTKIWRVFCIKPKKIRAKGSPNGKRTLQLSLGNLRSYFYEMRDVFVCISILQSENIVSTSLLTRPHFSTRPFSLRRFYPCQHENETKPTFPVHECKFGFKWHYNTNTQTVIFGLTYLKETNFEDAFLSPKKIRWRNRYLSQAFYPLSNGRQGNFYCFRYSQVTRLVS